MSKLDFAYTLKLEADIFSCCAEEKHINQS